MRLDCFVFGCGEGANHCPHETTPASPLATLLTPSPLTTLLTPSPLTTLLTLSPLTTLLTPSPLTTLLTPSPLTTAAPIETIPASPAIEDYLNIAPITVAAPAAFDRSPPPTKKGGHVMGQTKGNGIGDAVEQRKENAFKR